MGIKVCQTGRRARGQDPNAIWSFYLNFAILYISTTCFLEMHRAGTNSQKMQQNEQIKSNLIIVQCRTMDAMPVRSQLEHHLIPKRQRYLFVVIFQAY